MKAVQESLHIVCPHCDSINRVAAARIGDGPTCGKCKQPLFPGGPVVLHDGNFDKQISRNDIPVVVDFWAPWCGPCKMMSPVIEELADEYAEKARICKLNTDDAHDSAIEFGISSIPTIILFKDGKVEKKWVGLTSKKSLAAAIDELL